MAMVRQEIHAVAAQRVRQDLQSLQVSERTAARLIGISNSTLNAFLNLEYRTAQKRTIEKLLKSSVWSEGTRAMLETLRDYDVMLFQHRLPVQSVTKQGVAA